MNRRHFLGAAGAFTGVVLVSPKDIYIPPRRRKGGSASDHVALGKTGVRISRIGIGTGSNSGEVQRALGKEGFTRLIRYGYDHGISYIDTAEAYNTHDFVRDAIKGLPREKLFIQTKLPGNTRDPLERIERYCREMGVDYIDSVLTHCATSENWVEERKRAMDALDEAKSRKLVRLKGVSCHGLPALRKSAEIDWPDVHLVRVNPQGRHIDGPTSAWRPNQNEQTLPEAVAQIHKIRAKGHGTIGMKIIGNGEFTSPEDREKSIRYAMSSGLVDAIVIGFANAGEIDEALERVNRALAAV